MGSNPVQDTMATKEVHTSDLEKIRDVVETAYQHHLFRDEMNAKLHLAQSARLSPLTSELASVVDRLTSLIHD